MRLAVGVGWYLVPDAAFASPQEEASFRDLVRRKLGANAEL